MQNAPVAQLDRAFDYESKGCEFDSCPAHHIHRDVAQLGSALDLGSRGHRFESCHPDHYGEIAQLARAFGSYPEDREFESHSRYHLPSMTWITGPLAQLVRAVGS